MVFLALRGDILCPFKMLAVAILFFSAISAVKFVLCHFTTYFYRDLLAFEASCQIALLLALVFLPSDQLLCNLKLWLLVIAY